MATYLILNSCFILAAVLILRLKPRIPSRPWALTLVGLLVLAALFDSLIIYFDIVGYDTSKILGLYVGLAPIEDFFYAILAAVLIPAIWNKLGGRHA